MKHALVLGAGGYAASAWEIGVVTGLADGGVEVRDAGLLVGTSAGARVAAQLAFDVPLEELFRRQVNLAAATQPVDIDIKEWARTINQAKKGAATQEQVLKRIGALAMSVESERGAQRRQEIAAALPDSQWPARRLQIAAVEAESGTRHIFTRESGISLLDAAGASGALAGIWPPIEFRRNHYYDGGFYSTDNADMAAGFRRVLIIALREWDPPMSVVTIKTNVAMLQRNGAEISIIHPDKDTEAAFKTVGGNVRNPAVAAPAAHAGRAQGQALAAEVKAFLSPRTAPVI